MALSNAQLAQAVSNLIAGDTAIKVQFQDWLTGTAAGGPNLDGDFPLTDYQGNTFLVACPAAMASATGGSASAAAASLVDCLLAQTAAETAETNAELAETNAGTAQAAAETAQGLAETAKTAAESARTTAIAQAGAALASAVAAALSETNAATSETNAGVSETNAAASASAAAASAVTAATFDPALYAALADAETITGIYRHAANVRLENNKVLEGLNAAGSSWKDLIYLNASDKVTVGETTLAAQIFSSVAPVWYNGTSSRSMLAADVNEIITGDWRVNKGSNAQSVFNIGEATTVRGDAQDAALRLYGESAANIYGFQLSVYSVNAGLSGIGANPVTNLQVGMNLQMLSGWDITMVSGEINFPVNKVSDSNIGLWNTAYNWGDHASGGYAALASNHTISGIWRHASTVRLDNNIDIQGRDSEDTTWWNLLSISGSEKVIVGNISNKALLYSSVAPGWYDGTSTRELLNEASTASIEGLWQFKDDLYVNKTTSLNEIHVGYAADFEQRVRLLNLNNPLGKDFVLASGNTDNYGFYDRDNTRWDLQFLAGDCTFFKSIYTGASGRVQAGSGGLRSIGGTGSGFLELHGDAASYIDFSLDGTGGTDQSGRLRYYTDELSVEFMDFKVNQAITVLQAAEFQNSETYPFTILRGTGATENFTVSINDRTLTQEYQQDEPTGTHTWAFNINTPTVDAKNYSWKVASAEIMGLNKSGDLTGYGLLSGFQIAHGTTIANSAGSTQLYFNDAADGLRWRIGCSGDATDDFILYDNDLATTLLSFDDTTGDMVVSKNLFRNALGSNTSPGTDALIVGGYGIMGSRSGNVYVTNAHATGSVAIGVGGVHNVDVVGTFSAAGLAMPGVLTLSKTAETIIFDGATGPTGIKWEPSTGVAAEWVALNYRTTPDTLQFERVSDDGDILVLDPSDLSVNIGTGGLFVNSLAVPRYVTSGYTSGKITIATSAPSSPAKGDQWFDTS